MSRRAFSLIELLVSVAIMAMLISLLVPGLVRARAEARRVMCGSNLRELGQAFHMYAGEYRGRAMPLAYTSADLIGDGPPIYWWGTNDAAGVDHTRGFLWPYLHADLRERGLFECPDQPWGSYIPQGAATQVTSTYGYNGYYLSPPYAPGWSAPGPNCIVKKPWQNVDLLRRPSELFAFADTAIDLGAGRPENNALLDPPQLLRGKRWVRNSSPTTCFRHTGRTGVLHADGHVDVYAAGPGDLTSPAFRIGSVGQDDNPHYVPDCQKW
jgi:prepilin-type N-terminal cleavage/methylation domain-containing protein/prepilin-type processing-associated H-X9-DG protein